MLEVAGDLGWLRAKFENPGYDGNFFNVNLASMLLVNTRILVALCLAIQAQILTLYLCLE